MCELYYLDHFRDAVADAKAKAAAQVEAEEFVELDSAATEVMRKSLEMMSESGAKISLDLAFAKVTLVKNDAARERLVRYAGELHRRAEDMLDD